MGNIDLNVQSCELFNLPFFQFSQLRQYCPQDIPRIKAEYKSHWERWKKLNLTVAEQLGPLFAPPHIEKWCNGWQVRAHFFAYYQYAFYPPSAAILSVILNRRRLLVSLDWHAYRANRSHITLSQYNQWLTQLDKQQYADFDIWHGNESEYADFQPLKNLADERLRLRDDADFFCIGRNLEKEDLENHNSVEFISQTLRALLPLYELCHTS